jgi:hypothetical protein
MASQTRRHNIFTVMITSNLRLFRVANKYTELQNVPESASSFDLVQTDVGASAWTSHCALFKF